MLETSVDLRSSQAWSQFDDAMTQFGGPGGADAHQDAAGDDHLPAAESDEEPSDSGGLAWAHVVRRRKECASDASCPREVTQACPVLGPARKAVPSLRCGRCRHSQRGSTITGRRGRRRNRASGVWTPCARPRPASCGGSRTSPPSPCPSAFHGCSVTQHSACMSDREAATMQKTC